MLNAMPTISLVRTLIVDGQVRCASQMCEKTCPNYDKCIEAALWTMKPML